jgi:dihydroorotase
MAELLVRNGKILKAANIIEANIVVENGRIAKITKQDVTTDEEIDAAGCYVIPGLIDPHVHFRDFEEAYKGDWKTESGAAAAGGVTTVLDMPNNKPPIDSAERLAEKRKVAAEKSLIDYGLYFGADSANIEEVKKLANVAGVKFFLGKSTGDLLINEARLPDFFKALKSKRMLAACHCEKTALLEKYKKEKFKYLSEIRPATAEVMSIKDVVKAMCDNRVHICHVSSAGGLEEVRKAKHVNKKVTCEVTPHHLFLNKEDEEMDKAYLKMYPPLRNKADQAALLEGLKSGLIDMIGTDHAPHTIEEKEKDFNDAPGGVPGVEFLLPLALQALDIRAVVKTCCENPANAFKIQRKGILAPNMDADFVILDLKKEWKITDEAVFSNCGWTPYEGMEVKGKVEATFVRGQQVFDGENVIEAKGKEVTFTQ